MLPFLDDPLAWIASLPPVAMPLLVFVAAFLEYVFPPFPGDGLMLLGFFVAGQGSAALELVFLAAFLGGGLGAATAFYLGRRFGRVLVDRLSQRLLARGRRFVRLRAWLERHGERSLALNRFFPVLRGILLYGAGAGHLRFVPAILWASLSNLLHLGLLSMIGIKASASWSEIQETLGAVNRGVGVIVIVLTLVLLFVGRRLWQREAATESAVANPKGLNLR